MANYPQEHAQDTVCQSHTGHMTGLWFLPTRPLRLKTNEWMNEAREALSCPHYASYNCRRLVLKLPEFLKAQPVGTKRSNCVQPCNDLHSTYFNLMASPSTAVWKSSVLMAAILLSFVTTDITSANTEDIQFYPTLFIPAHLLVRRIKSLDVCFSRKQRST